MGLQQALAGGRFTIGLQSDAYSRAPHFSQVESFHGHDSEHPPQPIVIYWTGDAPPSVPPDLTATSVSATRIGLFWAAATDNHGTMGCKLYRDGDLDGWPSRRMIRDTIRRVRV